MRSPLSLLYGSSMQLGEGINKQPAVASGEDEYVILSVIFCYVEIDWSALDIMLALSSDKDFLESISASAK